MQFDEADTAPLKAWLISQLEDISDADSDVLGDYVLALVKSEEPEDEVRVTCLVALEDFLGDNTKKFVSDVFNVIHSKAYKPGYVAPAPVPAPTQAVQQAVPVSSSLATLPSVPVQNGVVPFGNVSRKRDYNDQQGVDLMARNDSHYGDRAQKQMRRGNQRGALHNGRSGRGYEGSAPGGFPNAMSFPDTGSMTSPPPGFPPMDPNNPMAAIMAMQAMGFPALPGFPPFPGAGSPLDQNVGERRSSGSFAARRPGERCRDYDTKGFCAAGSMCPYEHGSDHITAPGANEEYDPRQASLPPSFNASLTSAHLPKRQFDNARPSRGGRGGRGTQNSGLGPNLRGRAAFSSAAPNNDRNITTIVVEQIPEEHFSEQAVRAFFEEFGTIDEVTMQAYKRLALVKFSDYGAARRAYDSPKVIFDNRFVKVYWYKPDTVPTPRNESNGGSAKPEQEDKAMIDPAAFALKQAEAQRIHEEKAKKLKEAEAQKEELDRRIKAQAEERHRLLEKLVKKTGGNGAAPPAAQTNGNGTSTTNPPPTTQTEALRLKLAELEAEAETLGIAPDDPYATHSPSYRGRGGAARGAYIHRGSRGGFPPRGRGGRGGGSAAWAGFAGHTGAVARLDNRPKSVSVLAGDSNVDFDDSGAAESLRGFLFGVGEFGEIVTASTGSAGEEKAVGGGVLKKAKNRATVRFNERYVAEEFIRRAGGSEGIPGIGKVELGWVANPPVVIIAAAPQATMTRQEHADVEMGGADNKTGREDREMDYDIADDDDDRWAR